jgi:hypothetical protein
MNIGMIDLDKKNDTKPFPNIPLMKLSAWHKNIGDSVEWYDESKFYDLVYVSKVFSFSEDYPNEIHANEVVYGGSGFAIELVNGKEIYHKEKDHPLPLYVEKMYPDYDLYGITDTAYGFITRGCPRGCDFCHVKEMQGTKPYPVAKLSDFWRGQKNIVLLDPNITAYRGWKDVFQQLIDSGANVDFSQGLDIRCMTEEKAEMLKQIKVKNVHFAWDRYEDSKFIAPRLKKFREITGWGRSKVSVYVLVNFDTSIEQDLERIMAIKSLNFQPYVMRYNKQAIKRGSEINALARWVNFVPLFWKYDTFDDYKCECTKLK